MSTEAEIAELRKDQRRLDWLIQRGFGSPPWGTEKMGQVKVYRWKHDEPCRWTATRISSEFVSAREAIDAAMQAEEEHHG